MNAIEQFARSTGQLKVIAGVNMAHHVAYRIMIEQGFRTDLQGVAMDRPNEPGYDLLDVYIIDDWR